MVQGYKPRTWSDAIAQAAYVMMTVLTDVRTRFMLELKQFGHETT